MDRFQRVILTLTAMVCSTVVAVVFFTRPKAELAMEQFTAPGWDEAAVEGTPTILDKTSCYSTLEIPVTNEKCRVGIAAAPKLKDSELGVNFTSDEKNTMWLKLVVYDEAGNIIGQSGLIKNGEYVETVKLEGTASVGQQIKAKILTYQVDTYYSLGTAQATLLIR